MTHTLVRIGPKGQIVIQKEYRQKLNLAPGNYLEATLVPAGLLLRPFNVQKEWQDVRSLRKYITKHWEKGVDCVQATREERR